MAGLEHRVQTSPYSIGVEVTGRLVVVGALDELVSRNLAGAIVLLRGDLTDQPLTPKAFPFYQVDEHRKLVAHTARDTVQQVDERLLVQASEVLCSLIVLFPRTDTIPPA